MKTLSGFSLIEVLVALTLSLLLILGVGQVFVANREAYRTQWGFATLQENARMAVEVLRRDLSMAGYPMGRVQAFDSTTKDGGGSSPDQVSVRFLSDKDCVGNPVAKSFLSRVYAIQTDPVTKVPGLACNGVSLVDGVENMQLLYGIDTDLGTAKADGQANSYVTADKVLDWNGVVAVRFALLVSSVDPISKQPDEERFILLDAPPIEAAKDLLRRRVYFGTVLVRNQMFK